MKKNSRLLFIMVLVHCISSFGLTHIKGDIGTLTLDKAQGPYIVSEDIYIPAGKTATIKAGTVLLFKSFTGLMIFGAINVEGSPDNLVIFSSENDDVYNDSASQLPKAFDWNGITIDRNAEKIQFRNFRLCYSVYGIKSKRENILIINGVFKDNGQFNFTVNDQIQLVEDKVSYSYGHDAQKKTDSLKIVQIKNKYKRPEIIILSSGGASAISAIVLGIMANRTSNNYHDNSVNWGQQEKQDARQTYKVETGITIAAGITSVALLSTGIILHINKKNKLKKAATISMTFDQSHCGMTITSSF